MIVYRILAEGTIEEQILSLHADKRDLIAGVLERTDAAGRMCTEEMIDFIRAGAELGDGASPVPQLAIGLDPM